MMFRPVLVQAPSFFVARFEALKTSGG